MWDLPRPGLEPVSPALAGRFSTTAPPGKPSTHLLRPRLNCFSTARILPTSSDRVSLPGAPLTPVPSSIMLYEVLYLFVYLHPPQDVEFLDGGPIWSVRCFQRPVRNSYSRDVC